MLMCLCYGISCSEIKKIVQSGIMTTEGVQNECQAGTGCGCCLDALKLMVESEANKQQNELTLTNAHAVVVRGSSRSQCP